MLVFFALGTIALAQRTHMAGVFLEPVNLEGDERKELRSDDSIVFSDTMMADLDMDGHADKVSREDGLHISFWVNDSTSRDIVLSKEDGKIAVYDVNKDGIPDILQITGFGGSGLLFYGNTSMSLLNARMIPINEDGEGFFEYGNHADSSDMRYSANINTNKIRLEQSRNGIKLYPMKDWNGQAELSIMYEQGHYRDTIHCPVLVMPVNDAPVFTGIPAMVVLNEDESLDIISDSLIALVDDPDSGDVLSIYPVGDREELSGADSIYTYRPAENWHGDDSLAFVVTDGDLRDTVLIKLRVQPVNDAPVWTQIAPIDFPEDEFTQRSLRLFRGHVSDIDTPDSLLRFHAFSSEHIAISAEGGKITLMGDKNWFGSEEIMLVVSDGELRDSIAWSVTITAVNDAPELASLPDTLFNEDQTIYIQKTDLEKFAFDIETDASDLKWQVKRFGKVRAFYNGDHIRCTASPNWYGTDSLELTVSDGELTASRIWRVHVLPVNDPPTFTKRNMVRSFLEDDTLHILKHDLYKLVRDPETAPEDLQWTLMPSRALTLIENDLDYTLYAEPNWFGNAPMKIAVHDGEYGDTISYLLRVLSVNDKPVMQDLAARTWNEDDTLSIDMSYLKSLAKDVETKNSDLMWSYIPNPYIDIKQRKSAITLTPRLDWNGDTKIGVIVNDGGLRDTGFMDIRIKPVNDAPRWKALPDTSIAEDGSMTLPLSYIRSFVYDPDRGDEINIEYTAGKNFYLVDKKDTVVIWPLEDWFGKESMNFTASDGKKKVKKNWSIRVRSVNDPPYFTMGLPDSISFRSNGSDTLFFNDIVYDVDHEISDLVWEVTPGHIVRSMIDEKLGAIIFYTENYKHGEDAVTIRVTDGHDMITYYLPIYVKEIDRFLMANPDKLELLPNTPNPFTEYTDIRYSLPVAATVSIKIYNLLGKELKTLANGNHDAQNYSVRWWGETESGMPAPSGVYLCRMVAVVDGEPVVMMQKMMLVR